MSYQIKQKQSRTPLRKAAIFLFISIWAAAGQGADIGLAFPPVTPACSSIFVQGELRAGDAASLQSVVADNNSSDGCQAAKVARTVMFDSPGGDVSAALAMGQAIRAAGLATVVNDGAQCMRACSIAFLGGVDRQVRGRYGVHRPYPADPSRSRAEVRPRIQTLRSELEQYARQMRVGWEVFEHMLAVPSSTIDVLSLSEMIYLGVISAEGSRVHQVLSRR